MAAATSPDPMLLFTPEESQKPDGASNPGSPLTPIQTPQDSTPVQKSFSIVLTRMDNEKKHQYADFKLNVRDIVKKHTEGSKTYYYALLGDGNYHKIKAKALEYTYPNLIEEFERKKSAGSLPPFDPSGTNVHPYSRIRMTIKLKGRTRTSAHAQDSTAEYQSESNRDGEEFSEYDDDGAPIKLRRSGRIAPSSKKKKKRLMPYSPVKTRSHKPFIVGDSDSEDGDDIEEIVLPRRRSTRTKTNAKASVIDQDYTDEGDDDSTDDNEGPLIKSSVQKKKKVIRGRASRPAYGNFRVVADLEFDLCSDEDTAPLRMHRDSCERCGRSPAHTLLQEQQKKPKPKGRRRKDEDEDDEEDGEKLAALGGWVRCLKCPVASHWKCLNVAQRSEILKAALDRDTEEYNRTHATGGGERKPLMRQRLDAYRTTEFICNYCLKGGDCMGCKAVALKPDPPRAVVPDPDADGDVPMVDSTQVPAPEDEITSSHELLFRCVTCKRLAHYAHLTVPSDVDDDVSVDAVDLAGYYQETMNWMCSDCSSYVYPVDKILAWRPLPPDAVEPDTPNYKNQLPREYLIKWQNRSYRRTQWVPHMWLLSTHPGKLSNFVQGKVSRVELLKDPIQDGEDIVEAAGDDRREVSAPPLTFGDVVEESAVSTPLPDAGRPDEPIPDAQCKIPLPWQTVDRVLDILLWTPSKGQSKKRKENVGTELVTSSAESPKDEVDPEVERERAAVFEQGEEPSKDYSVAVSEWEKKMGRKLNETDVDQVIWAFVKWRNLGYEESSWDSPPRPGEPYYAAFVSAFNRFLAAREVHVNKLSKAEAQKFDNRPKDEFKTKWALDGTPDLGQCENLQLMPFQVQGVNWLSDNWWIHQHCILADEMGLGKTVQIVVFIGTIVEKFKASPCLIVVPNSTITNWVREFDRWAPHIRVVPYHGEAKARGIIRRYELFHDSVKKGTTSAKYHVLITTYDMLSNQKEFGSVFNSAPRWETLVVDEGQRLKSDNSLIFRKLNELNTMHRIILTGTPLNNNIRELFNLMNFLDPNEWNNLKELAKEYEVLTEELVKSLHSRLRPYFLRRIKSEVLQLPPKNEVIVPVTMTPLQKEIYRSILSQNLDVFQTFTQQRPDAKTSRTITKTNMNNTLMQMRKCLQHPYLVSDDIEPAGLSDKEAHGKLIDASAKLRLLRIMLPKLKARGHRVLLFSQFKIVLDIIEDFLDGEGFKLLRLDGDTPSIERQRGIDEYNRQGSDVFIYLLTTRAGGVGINLYTSDTVIIFDPDFNPHQDLQAISRAHRYGQQKPCLVFKLMVKSSAEDRIMQMGKKKLALDHVIVQTMDEDGSGEDVQSILTFGAQELFQEDESNRGIVYTDVDIDTLIEKTEKEGDQVEEENSNMAFSFAKVWSTDKGELEEMNDATPNPNVQSDSWAQTLEQIASEREKVRAKEVTGRGAKRKAAAVFPQHQLEDLPDSPKKPKSKKSKKRPSVDAEDSDAYMSSIHDSEDTETNASVKFEPLLDLEPAEISLPTEAGTSYKKSSTSSIPGTSMLKFSGPSRVRDSTIHGGVSVDLAALGFKPEDFRLPIQYPVTTPIDSDHSSIPKTGIKRTSKSQMALNPLPLTLVKNGTDSHSGSCSLCELVHKPGKCHMTKDSRHLAEYRLILITEAGNEALETRRAAIKTIDETLMKRGDTNLIKGHPKYLVTTPSENKAFRKLAKSSKKTKSSATAHKTANLSVPGSSTWVETVAGSAKRVATSSLEEPPRKKIKDSHSSSHKEVKKSKAGNV